MNLIANTGIQFFTVPLEINLNDNFKMYFHEWYDTGDKQLKLEIAHFFSEEDVWVKKHALSELGYATFRNDYKVTETWETIKNDEGSNATNAIIPIETEKAHESGCFQLSISRISWEIVENVWFPMPFFLLNGNRSEFGPTNWCRFKLIPVETTGKSRKYNLLVAFDTRSVFEKEDFEDEDLNERPVFTNAAERSKEYALCNDEYKLIGYCSEASHCDWVDKYVLKRFHQVDTINDLLIKKPKLNYLAQYIYSVCPKRPIF
jgi:hypothetical protein